MVQPSKSKSTKENLDMVISSLMTNTMVLRLYITADDILPMGDGFIYTVQLVNNDSTTDS